MTKKELRERCTAAADQIECMLIELRGRGLSEASAVALVTGMLSSTTVYTPFSGITEEPTSQYRH